MKSASLRLNRPPEFNPKPSSGATEQVRASGHWREFHWINLVEWVENMIESAVIQCLAESKGGFISHHR
jgi:hypothetical protein